MAYLYLSIALLAGATKGYCGKRTSGRITGWHDTMLANLVRMLLCIAIGFGMVVLGGDVKGLLPDGKALLIYAISGISTSVFVVTWLVAVRTSAYMLMDVFLMLGVVVPMSLGSLCYGETIHWNQWVGLLVLLIATLILCSYNNGIKEKLTVKGFVILLISGVANGITGFSQKMFQKEAIDAAVSVFNFYTYVFSAASLGLVLLFVKRPAQQWGKPSAIGSVFGYVAVMAISLFLNSYFMTMAAAGIPSAQLYPLDRGASIILSALMSAVFFREKLTVKAIVGLVLAFVGLLIINLL